MDRRMPPSRSRVSATPVVSGIVLSLCGVASGMDPESRPVSLGLSGGSVEASTAWLPWCVCAIGLGVTVWAMVRRMNRLRRQPQGSIQVIDRTAMGRGRALALVRVGDRVVLVGESAEGFQRLAEFDASDSTSQALVARRLAS